MQINKASYSRAVAVRSRQHGSEPVCWDTRDLRDGSGEVEVVVWFVDGISSRSSESCFLLDISHGVFFFVLQWLRKACEIELSNHGELEVKSGWRKKMF